MNYNISLKENSSNNSNKLNALLALKDGTVFEGIGFGAEGIAKGELCFNTSMVGYEESLTDPSYKGQILTMTYPLIGNYGVRKGFFESDKIQVEGFVVKENSEFYEHRIAVKNIDKFLREHKIPGISGVDTREITRKLRIHGVMNSVLITSKNPIDKEEAIKQAKNIPDVSELDILKKVSVKEAKDFDCKGKKTIAIVDLGVKQSIIAWLMNKKVNVKLVPYNTPAQEILDMRVNGVLLSNGPGNPEKAVDAIKLAKEIQGRLPLFGVCLGHQIIGLGLGAKTYKLKFGHRGSNQPVKNLEQNKVYITAQNHGYAVDENSVDGTDLKVTMINLNDKSVEGISDTKNNVHSVQFHPEAGPGPLDCNYIFDEWIKLLK